MTESTDYQEQLLRIPYHSTVDDSDREYFLYLPKSYGQDPDKKWPLMLFMHGDGERGDGKDDLDYVLVHGPVYEAWFHKKDLPFIIISPQLHFFGRDKMDIDYIDDRTKDWVPKRLENETPDREYMIPKGAMKPGEMVMNFEDGNYSPQGGWVDCKDDLMGMIEKVQSDYQVDENRIYATGLSYGGYGAWYLGSLYPEKFAAIVPVVAWGHPELMPSIAQRKLPVWNFAGGRDPIYEKKYFYAGMNKLEELGHKDLRFTVHEDMDHDTWRRVYQSQDTYDWLLSHKLD